MSSKSSESISFPGRYWWTSIVVMHSHIQCHLYRVSTPKHHWWFVDLSPPERRGKRAKVGKPQQSFAASPPNSRAPAAENQKKWVGLSEKLVKQQVFGFEVIHFHVFLTLFCLVFHMFHIFSYVFIASFFGSYTFRHKTPRSPRASASSKLSSTLLSALSTLFPKPQRCKTTLMTPQIQL